MANLTIVVEEGLLRRARLRALEQGTSVNALLRSYLEAYASPRAERVQIVEDILHLSRRSRARRGSRKVTRDELHDR